ncbi:bacteriocin [Neisseria sp. WF04]|nr:bacteriocin [Neisseria sp. WF04]
MRTLNANELSQVSGGWVANAAGAGMGAVGGHLGYMASTAASGQYNPWAHAAAVVTGAGEGH